MGAASKPGGPRWIAATASALLLLVGACGGGPEPELVTAPPTPTPEPTPVVEPTPVEEPTPTPDAEVKPEDQTPTPEPTPAPPVWRVVDTVDGLNLRTEPTTSAEIAVRLDPGTGGLVGTGETAAADGFDWLEIEPDGDRPGGWLAEDFVVPDEAAAAPVSSRVCFHSEADGDATTVVLDFDDAAETFTGGVRLVLGDNVEYWGVAGRRLADQGSVFTVAIQGVDSNAVRTEEWTSGADGISLGDTASAAAVDCAEVADLVSSVDLNVTVTPDLPG